MNSENRDYIKEEEIDLLEIIKRLWSKRRFIVVITAIFAVIGIVTALLKPNMYTASSVVVPQSSSGKSGGVSSLASAFGVSLGDGNSGDITPQLYDKVFSNVDLQKELYNTPIYFSELGRRATLVEYATDESRKGISLNPISWIFGGKKSGGMDDSLVADTKVRFLSADEFSAHKAFKEKYSIDVDTKNGSVTISVTLEDRYAAAELAELITSLLQSYIIKFKVQSAQDNYKYIEERYNESKVIYDDIKYKYAKFLDANKVISTAKAKIEQELLASETSIVESQFRELSSQLLNADLKVKQDSPTFVIIKPVDIPLEKSAPSRAMIVIAITFLGGIFASALVLVRDWLKKSKEVSQES